MKKFLLSLISMLMVLSGTAFADNYQKVTATEDITDGEYLIVYEAGNVAFNGALETLDAVGNTVAVTITDGTIASSETIDAATFTIKVSEGSLKSASGKYIGQSSYANGLSTSDDIIKHSFSIDDSGNAVVSVAVNETQSVTLRYNKSSNQTRFRYYKSGQDAIQLYKKVASQEDTRTATTIELSEGYATNGEVGATIALPTATVKAGDAAVEGAAIEWISTNTGVATIEGSNINLLAAGTTTIKATYAGNETYKGSTASYTLSVTAAPYTSLQALQEAVTSTSTPVAIKFTDVFVTAVKGSNAYLADADGYGVLVYTSNHGLEAGQVLNGTINAKLVLYQGKTEITNFTKEGLTITTTELTPTVKTIDAITAANQSTLVTLKNVTFADGKLSDGVNEITYYDNFSAGTPEADKAYDITGIVILHNTTLEIAPRSAADIKEYVPVYIQNADFSSAEGWTAVVSSEYRDLGMYQIGGEQMVRFAAPTADDTHLTTEYAAGFECRWNTNFASYTQTTAEIPAGSYSLVYDVENVNDATTKAEYENRFTVTVGETVYTDDFTEWMNGKSAWTTHGIPFTLAEAQSVTISLGYGTGSNNIGANNTPAIYVSHLKLVTAEEYEAIKLDAARKKKAAELEALPRGNDLFQYSNEALLDAIAALAAAKTVEEIAAVKAVQNLPDTEKLYSFQLKDGGNYMVIDNGIKLAAKAKGFSFVPDNGGGYALKDGDSYVACTGTGKDIWTMSATAEPYSWTIAALADGYYTIAKASAPNEHIGVDNTDAGSSCYADKGVSDKALWAIAEYVAPTLYTVSIAEGLENGTVAAEPTSAEAGEKVQLTATPAEGYALESYSVTCKTIDEVVLVAEDGTFTMPADDVTVSATFVEAAPVSGVTLVASEGAYAASANNYVKEWTSNTNPIVTVTTGANNMDKRVTETFLWHSGSAGSSTYTISVPINYIITSCTITAKGNSAEQTITAGETEKTFGTADYEELVLSELSNPSTSFTLTGANASGLLIQKIELGIAPNPNFNISNDKAYALTTPRGSLGVSDGQLVSTAKDFTASNFAIISYNDAYYLWSVEAGRFIQDTGDASNYAPTPISFVALDGGKFQLRYGNNAINISSGYAPGLIINGWTTVDPGNTYTIEAAADFDATEALAILETPITFTNKVTDLANLSNVKAYVITNARGTWNVNYGETAMTPKKFLPDAASEQFALLQQQGQYFIYSVNAKKFLNPDNTFGKPVPVNISATGNEDYPWFFAFDDSHNINVSGGEVVINGWSTIDEGNSNAIIEATDFDSKDAMAALYEYFRLFADGKYYISNVGTGKYLAAGSNWGTHAVVNADGLDYDIKMADGKYTLDSQVSNGGNNHYLNGEWNDGAAMGWIFNEVSEGVYTISNGTNFLTAGENGVVTLAADGTVDAAKWTLKTLEDRIAELAAATAETPVDATFLIQDANFGRNDLRKSAWTMVASNQNLSGGEDNNNGSVGNNCAESYHSTFTLSQTLANAPAGKYKMTAQGFYRQDDGATEDLPVFYANDKTANFPAKTGSEGSMTDASKSFSAGQYTIEPIEVTVFENGQLTVGAKGTAVHQWVIFDNFRLSYLGSEIPAEEFAPAYETALSNAKKALDDETYAAVTGEERTALAAAIETYSTVEETVDAYKTAISALTAATTTFTGAKADYDALVAAKAANAERSYAYADADKKAAAEASLTVEATSAADAKEKATAIWTAFRKYADSHALAEGVEGAINMTDHIVNPNAAEAIAEPWTVVKGEGSGGSLNILDGEPLTDGEGNTYKYFDGGDWGANAWDVALKQTINLPAGKYMITASGRASADVQLSLLVGEEKTAIPAIGATGGLFGRGWDDASKEFELDKASEVVIGVQGVTSVIHNWMSFTRFRLVCLEKVEVPAVVLNAPTFNAEEGTQAEPNIYPADFKLKINYSADNLEENGYNAEDLKVKVTVMVSGDLPENLMNMQSETKHSVMGQSFYIDLGETDFPVELKSGYVYQNIVVVTAQLVKPGSGDGAPDEVIATYAGAPAQLHWIGIAPAVKLTVAANIESGTAEEPGTSKGFTTVEAGSEFKLMVSAENLEANGLNPEELTLEIGMVMESMFTDPSWPMGVPNTSSRIMKQNVVVPFAEEIVLEDVVFDKNFPFIQSINLAGITLKKGDETITAINEALVVRLIEVYENGAPVGIKGIGVDGEKASIYDLSGRKVEKMQRGGIYIVNGKKVSVK